MTEITSAAPATTGSLSTLRLAELQQLATSMGISVNAKMRKADLVSAIRQQRGAAPAGTGAPQGGTAPTETIGRPAERPAQTAVPATEAREDAGLREQAVRTDHPAADERRAPQERPAREDRPVDADRPVADGPISDPADDLAAALDRAQAQRDGSRTRRSRRAGSGAGAPRSAEARQTEGVQAPTSRPQDQEQAQPAGDQGRQQAREDRQRQGGGREAQQTREPQQVRDQGPTDRDGYDDEGDDDGRRGRRRNRNRNRDRKRNRPGGVQGQPMGQRDDEEAYSDEDVLVPVGGILDLLDNYAFIRTTGYLPGPTDVYVPLGMVKKHGLRKGDAVQGAIKAPQDGSDAGQHTVSSTGNKRDRGKFSALVRLDRVNGRSPEEARRRPDFAKLTPLYPQDRLRLETEQKNLTTRVIDLVAPIGKGQRGLLVAPAKAGKTLILQSIANAITTNNPECHLMVVLVDERPEEVTDMERAVKGEVISSTFDRPADDHTTVAELAIERAKRLVELGGDVVVLLDSITRLGRAYNLAAPASGRILSGGVDSAALYPPKRFFGAARNIENGGSLTILATALVETGSKMDEVIFEEFKGTGNMELKLDRQLANRRIFPAVDVNASGTRREEILMSAEELKIMWKLRRVLSALDQQQGIELLLDRLRKTKHNFEFLTQVQQTSSIKLDDED